MGILKSLWDAFTIPEEDLEESSRQQDAAMNAQDAAIEDGCRLREIFVGMSDEERDEWSTRAELYEDYRFKAATFITLWDEDSTWGVCVPGKHDEAKRMDVSVKRRDGSTATKHVGVMFAVAHELEDKRRWLSICMIIE